MKEITVQVNGEESNVASDSTLLSLLRNMGADPERVAVLVNGDVVRREKHVDTRLTDGDAVEIVILAGGGSGTPAAADGGALRLGDHEFGSRLILGTGKFSSVETMVESVVASGCRLVTVALKRFNPDLPADDLHAPLAVLEDVTLVPNTSGALDATEAVRAAELGRELSRSPFVKLEIHPNPHHLLPDPIETLAAAATLVREDFVVLPYMPADPVLAKRLEDVGCAAVMPLGSAIGSGHGLATADMLRVIVEESNVPVIVDAGLRSPSEAMRAMEMGIDGVLVNSAIATAGDPPRMAAAFAAAVETGRRAREAGIMAMSAHASATSPLTSFLSET